MNTIILVEYLVNIMFSQQKQVFFREFCHLVRDFMKEKSHKDNYQ